MLRTTAGLMLLLLAPALFAQPGDTPEIVATCKPFEQIYTDPALNTGDLDAHALTLATLIEKNASLAALRRWDSIKSEVSNARAIYNALAVLAKDNFKACGLSADEFAESYAQLARMFSTDLSWQNTVREWQGITRAAYVGPFADGSASAHDDVFTPEVMVDFGTKYPGAYGPNRWQQVKHTRSLKSELDLYDQQRWSGYCYYVATALISDEDRDCVIKLNFSGPAKVWLSGDYLLDADARRQELPDEFQLHVKLKRGRNVLLVKLSSIATLSIKLRDPAGQPLKKVLAVVPGADDKPVPMRGGKPRIDRDFLPDSLTQLSKLIAQIVDAKRAVPVLIARAVEFSQHGLHTPAWGDFERVYATPGRNAVANIEYLRSLDRGSLYSSSERRRLTRSITDELLASDPTFIPGVIEKAKLLSSDERFEEAVTLLRGALQHTSAPWRIQLQLADIFRDADWVAEQRAALQAALKDAPESLPVLSAASDFYASVGALAREAELDTRRLAIASGDTDAHMSLANSLSRTGDLDGSIKHWRILAAGDPGNDFILGRMAEVLAGNGRLEEALQIYEQLSIDAARPEEALYQAARVCLQLGRESQGAALLDRVVAFDPGHHLARRQLQRMRGESEDFWSEHAIGWEEALQHDITREQFPRAASGVILDELIQYVYPDGSSVSYVHTVRRILTQDGVDARGKERISGELVTARTILPDGTVLEPITQPGGLVEFPGVKIGSILDVAYVVRSDGGPLRTLDGDAFFFVDQSLGEPFAISRWVVIAPTAMALNVVYHGLKADDPGVTITSTTAAETTVRVWDVRDPRLPEAEQFMPAPAELVPWIECVQPRDWRIRARRLADEGLRNVQDTPVVRERAFELTNTIKSPEAAARAIYDWVNANFTTQGDAWNAHQALNAGQGDREQVFISLAAAAGIELGFAYVDPAPGYKSAPAEALPRPHWAYPNKEDFDGFMIVVRADDGGYVWIDMTDRMRPFGEVPARLANAPAILWMAGQSELTFLPGTSRERDRFENRVHIQLKPDGGAEIAGSIDVIGERSYTLKEDLRTMASDDLRNELEGSLAQQYNGFELKECEFPKLDVVGEPLVQSYKGTVRKIGTVGEAGMSLALPGEKLGRLLSILVGSRKREFDIVLSFDLVQTDEIRISAPEGMVFSELPADLVYPTAPLTYELKFRLDDGDLLVTRKLVLGPGRFKPAEYNDLVEQIKRIKQAEDSVVKLAKE